MPNGVQTLTHPLNERQNEQQTYANQARDEYLHGFVECNLLFSESKWIGDVFDTWLLIAFIMIISKRLTSSHNQLNFITINESFMFICAFFN